MKNKGMLRFICLFTLSIGLLYITGCSGSQVKNEQALQSAGVKNIVMWKFQSNKEDYMIYDWIKEWNAMHPDVQVKLELIPYNDYLSTRLATAFATNSAPDVYMISAGGFLKYASTGCALPLDDYIDDDLKNDFFEKSLKTVTYNGKIMGIPIEREPVALFYNKKVFEDKGLKPPVNWKDFQDSVKRLNSKSMAGIYIPVEANDYQNFIFYSFLTQAGGAVIDESTNTSKFGEKGAKVLNLWRNLSRYRYNVETSIQSPSDINPLVTGKAAMQPCGYWAVKSLEKFYPEFEYGVVPLPYPEDGYNTSVYGGWFQIVNPKSKYAEDAAKFTLWMWGEEDYRPLQWCTEASTKFPARKSVIENNRGAFSSDVGIMFKENILANAIPEPRYPVEISNIISKAIQDTMFTDKSIESIVSDADRYINEYIRNKGK